jgi:serine/threonine protein kinase
MTSPMLGGRFRLGAPLGGHRTGEVFEAVDVTTGLPCVVKRIAPNVFPTPLTAQRAERELRQLSKLQTHRVAKVLEVGRDDDRLWVALESVTGAPLGELIGANGPLLPATAVRAALEIGEALVDAAKLGVIHRDVSPKNIIVDGDQVKILNFGIPTPTTDKVFGVPEFLSPEQVEGRPVDQRSTIYSLASLLHYMLSGDPPFQGETGEVLQKQVSASPPAVSTKATGIPVELDRILLRAMEKQSSRRHLTLRQLLSELEPFAGPPPAQPAPRPSASAPIPRPTESVPSQPVQSIPRPAESAPSQPVQSIPRPAESVPVATPEPVPVADPIPVAAFAPVPITPSPAVLPARGAQPGRGGIRETLIGMPIPNLTRPHEPRSVPAIQSQPSVVVEDPPTERNPVYQEPSIIVDRPEPTPPPVAAPAPAPVVAERVPPPVAEPTPPPTVAAVAPSPPVVAEAAPPPQMYVVPPLAPEPAPPSSASAATGLVPATGKKKPTGSQKSAGGKKGKFRETMWFKKGELDEAAAAAAAQAKPGDLASDKADEAPIEERYKDDGSLSADDRARLSLRTGGTQTQASVREPVRGAPTEGMEEDDLVGEMKAGRGKALLLIGIAAALVIALVVVYLVG